MADIADQADDHIYKELEMAIRAARGILPAETESADCCVECSLEIPSARMLAVPGCQLCWDCATRLEGLRLRGLV